MMRDQNNMASFGRRAVLKQGTLLLAASFVDARTSLAQAEDNSNVLRFGLVTDLHYANKTPAGTRHYRETLEKLEEASEAFRENRLDFLVELGDFIDAAESVELETNYLRTVNQPFSLICKDRHYVLGNHCVDTLKKQEFLDVVHQQQSYYSFDRQGFHFIVLDACFRSDGVAYQRKNFHWTDCNVPAAELEWLEADLKANDKPVIVFAHQRLDITKSHSVKNNAEVRKVLETGGNVLAVFQGHSHGNDLSEIGGIHYCTLVAMVEGSGSKNNGYCQVELFPSGMIRLHGFRKQESYDWKQQDRS